MRIVITKFDMFNSFIFDDQKYRMSDIGLKREYHKSNGFTEVVIDKQLFMLAVIKYGIVFEELKC